MSRHILNGWKEIASYIERGVRTAQRWEALLGMPVHRPALKDRSAVVAFSDELDRWITRTSLDGAEQAGKDGMRDYREIGGILLQVLDNLSTLAWHTSELASQIRALQEQLRRPLENHRNGIASGVRADTAPPSRSLGAMLPFPPRHTLDLSEMGPGGEKRTGRVQGLPSARAEHD